MGTWKQANEVGTRRIRFHPQDSPLPPDAAVITAGAGGGDLAAHAQQSGQRYIMPRYLKAADLAPAGSIITRC